MGTLPEGFGTLNRNLFARVLLRPFYLRTFRTSDHIATIYRFLRNRKNEEAHVVFLDARARFISRLRLGVGYRKQILFDIADIIEEAMLAEASAMYLIHNHPSGDPTPSEYDVLTTMLVQQALTPCGIRIFDHVIIGKTQYYSLLQGGFLAHDPFEEMVELRKLKLEAAGLLIHCNTASAIQKMITAVKNK